uniref:Uncharacterized protein n=1 Tax=Anguilla anguilla TaxID=7936 RepID=A0A0E9VEQ3_ANGAN
MTAFFRKNYKQTSDQVLFSIQYQTECW